MPRTKKLLVAFVAGIAVFSLAAVAAAAGLTPAERSVLQEMNTARTSRGLPRLRIDYHLEQTATAHSADMLRRQYFAHGAFAPRVESSGARGPVFGENLAWGPISAWWVVTQWLASPDHRANLLRRGFRRVGIGALIGRFSGSSSVLVVTADFAGR